MFIKNIDLFGAQFEFRAFGKTKYKTIHGGIISLLACILMGVVIYLFGKDFFYKMNPNIFSKQEIPAIPKLIVPSNKNFSIMWKIEDETTALVSEDKRVFYPFFEFFKYSRNSQGSWFIEKTVYPTDKKCNESSNKDNPQLEKLALDVWHCVDWEEITEKLGEQVKYGGQWDSEGPLFILKMDFTTCPYSEGKADLKNCSTIDQVSEALSTGAQFFSFNIPTYNFDTTDYDSPVKQDYKYIFFRASSRIAFTKYFYLMQETIFDDRGWILEDNMVREGIFFYETVSVTRFVGDSDFDKSSSQTYLAALIYFSKPNKLHYRSYIKIQELFANIGGVLKLIMLVFGFVSREISREMLEVEVVNNFLGKTVREVPLPRLNINSDNSSVGVANKSDKKKIKVSFFKIFKYKTYCFKKELRNVVRKEKINILKNIDVVHLIDKKLRTNLEVRNGETANEVRNRINRIENENEIVKFGRRL